MSKTKILLVGLIAFAIATYFVLDLDQYLTLDFAQSQLAGIEEFKDENFALTAILYFAFYVAITALSIPGAVIITLLGGRSSGLVGELSSSRLPAASVQHWLSWSHDCYYAIGCKLNLATTWHLLTKASRKTEIFICSVFAWCRCFPFL